MNTTPLRTRRICLAPRVFLAVIVALGLVLPGNGQVSSSTVVIDASVPASPPKPLPFPVGGPSPTGHAVSANDRYLTLDGRPWFPLMGEFHYTRYPEGDWEKEVLKMKAAGIQVVSTYVFWIHHEEVEGQFDWTGRRNLRGFVELCAKNGLYVWIRIGPWDHGEVRNGGFPDWLIDKASTRENNPVYLEYVRRFDSQIAKQVQGLFWKDGGPIIGVQLENEYSARGPGKGEDHILELRRIARDAGLDAPFYTITGWDNAVIPSRDVLPLFGGYADGFWWRSLTDLPPSANYFFTKIRCEENVGDDLQSKRPDIDRVDTHYPYLTAEMGAGMASSYHRRPVVSADDTAAMEIVKLGSGVVGYGYYMFHGGTNPDGIKSTLQESQATGYINDLPVKTYDFQAPLGEFGQEHPSYRVLKTLHLFLNDFGSQLAAMTPYFPENVPQTRQDLATPRVAARIEEQHGFVFINNHERARQLPAKNDFQIQLRLPSGVVQLPRTPTRIPGDAYTIWPVNLDLGPTTLRYATAQLLCRLAEPRTYVFFAWPGIPPELVFEDKPGTLIETFTGRILREPGIIYVDGITPGTQASIRLTSDGGTITNIVVLSREQALNLWKVEVGGKDRLILSPADLYLKSDRLHLVALDPSALKAGFFPGLEHPPTDWSAATEDGMFQTYAAHVPKVVVPVEYQKTMEAGTGPVLKMKNEVAMAPDDGAFSQAAQWTITVHPVNSESVDNIFLKLRYEGDVGRLYAEGKLLTDNFYNGSAWWIGMDRIPPEEWNRLQLQVLPLRDGAPLYMPKEAWPTIPAGGRIATLNGIEAAAEYDVSLEFKR
ncbi:MAG TPA: beta-galactosidase [Silvibacterium sp.]|nr:beta-galactosidase [Silvibacterium sp.]